MFLKSVASRRKFLLMSAVPLAIALKACQGNPPDPKAPQATEGATPTKPSTPVNSADSAQVSLYGAGATFPSFLYLRWFKDYNQQNPNIQVSYQPVGSAAGIQQFLAGTVDFGASELALTDQEVAQVTRGAVMIPTAG